MVLAVGTDEDLQDTVRVDDHVIFSKNGGEEIDADGRELRIVQRILGSHARPRGHCTRSSPARAGGPTSAPGPR